jgi:hypothetical protein
MPSRARSPDRASVSTPVPGRLLPEPLVTAELAGFAGPSAAPWPLLPRGRGAEAGEHRAKRAGVTSLPRCCAVHMTGSAPSAAPGVGMRHCCASQRPCQGQRVTGQLQLDTAEAGGAPASSSARSGVWRRRSSVVDPARLAATDRFRQRDAVRLRHKARAVLCATVRSGMVRDTAAAGVRRCMAPAARSCGRQARSGRVPRRGAHRTPVPVRRL